MITIYCTLTLSVASFSQKGADVLADGVELLTATNHNGATPASVSGTSYSCALVTGICARLIASDPELSPQGVREALYAQAEDLLEPGFDSWSGWGVILAYQDDLSMYPGTPVVHQGKGNARLVSGCEPVDTFFAGNLRRMAKWHTLLADESRNNHLRMAFNSRLIELSSDRALILGHEVTDKRSSLFSYRQKR